MKIVDRLLHAPNPDRHLGRHRLGVLGGCGASLGKTHESVAEKEARVEIYAAHIASLGGWLALEDPLSPPDGTDEAAILPAYAWHPPIPTVPSSVALTGRMAKARGRDCA